MVFQKITYKKSPIKNDDFPKKTPIGIGDLTKKRLNRYKILNRYGFFLLFFVTIYTSRL